MKSKTIIAFMFALGLAAAASGDETATGNTATCTFTEILASNQKKGVDPKLSSFADKLSKAPFASFDTFTQLNQLKVNVDLHRTGTALLSEGTASLVFKDKLGVTNGKTRMRMSVDFDNKSGHRVASSTWAVDSGEPSFPVAGVPANGGTYVLALVCTM
jgi:hypothetical protein